MERAEKLWLIRGGRSVNEITARINPDFSGKERRAALAGAQAREEALQVASELAGFKAAEAAKKAAEAKAGKY